MVREPGHIRRAGRGGSAQSCISPASSPGSRRASRAPRPHMRNTMDNSGTPVAGEERSPSGTRGRAEPAFLASAPGPLRQPRVCPHTVLAKFRVRGAVGGRQGAHDDLHSRQQWKYLKPYDFAKAPFQPISLHRTVRVAGHDESHARGMQKGSDVPNLEVRGSESLPLLAYPLELSPSRQPSGARKAAVRPRRISTGV